MYLRYYPTLKISYYNLDQLISFTKPRSTNHGTALEADLPPPEVAPLPLHLAQVVVRAAVGAADRAQDHAAAGGTAGATVGHCGREETGVSRVNGELHMAWKQFVLQGVPSSLRLNFGSSTVCPILLWQTGIWLS